MKLFATSLAVAFIGLPLLAASDAEAANTKMEDKLLEATCDFDQNGKFGGAIYSKNTLSAQDINGGIWYVYSMEGCGGGNHSEQYVAYTKKGKVLDTRDIPDATRFGGTFIDKIYIAPQTNDKYYACMEGQLQMDGEAKTAQGETYKGKQGSWMFINGEIDYGYLDCL
jgi:predicted outer membrane repeat protein